MKYVAPKSHIKACTCPHCNVYAKFAWGVHGSSNELSTGYCTHCNGRIYWLALEDADNFMFWPRGIGTAPMPHAEMPVEVAPDFDEARFICSDSPRGAAALLRLAVQKLCVVLGQSGKNINIDIGALVQAGLPVEIQQALDIVRVTGNNAVHPGEMQLEEDPGQVQLLFELVNMIVDNRISQPRRVQEMYERLPEGALDGISQRDN